jgi:DMSO/TMAO reductase YedYZ molybdopterin-dependent catalytic subunit
MEARMSEVLALLGPLPGASRVLVAGFDDHSQPSQASVAGASWIFTFEQLTRAGAFLATHMNGAPLALDHGAPVRLFVPGWYGCACIKWVNEIRLVGENEPATSQMQEFAARPTRKVCRCWPATTARPRSINRQCRCESRSGASSGIADSSTAWSASHGVATGRAIG